VPELPPNVVSAGDFPGSIRIPGTDAALKLGARIENSWRNSVLALPAAVEVRPVPGYSVRSWAGLPPEDLLASWAKALNALNDSPHAAGVAALSRRRVLQLGAATAVERLAWIVTALAIILRLDIADLQESIAADSEVNKCRLDAWLDVDDASLVYVADITFLASAFDVEFFEHTIFDDGDAALLGLEHINEHFFFHKFKQCKAIFFCFFIFNRADKFFNIRI